LILPTQGYVGNSWVARKIEKDFSTEDEAQDSMDDEIIPAVLCNGSGQPYYYIVDAHNTLAALDYSGYDETKVKEMLQYLFPLPLKKKTL